MNEQLNGNHNLESESFMGKSIPAFCPICGNCVDQQTGICSGKQCGFKVQVSSNDAQKTVSAVQKNRNGGTTFITVFLSIILFVLLLCSFMIFFVRNTVKQESIKAILDNISISDISEILEDNIGYTIDDCYDFLAYEYGIQINSLSVNRILEKSTIKKFIASRISGFCNDFFEGEAELRISKNGIKHLLFNNYEVLEENLDIFLDFYDIHQIVEQIGLEEELVLLSSENIKKEMPVVYDVVKTFFSYTTLIVFVLLSLLVVIAMIRNSISQAALGIGIDMLIVGLLLFPFPWNGQLLSLIGTDSIIINLAEGIIKVNSIVSVPCVLVAIVILGIRFLAVKLFFRKKTV